MTWRRATLFTATLAFALALLATAARDRFEWGPPEIPKVQCEALDASSLPTAFKAALVLRYRANVATAIIREPQNTWSNLAFVFAGALIFAHDGRAFARLLGTALIALGIASGLYHASLLPAWRTVDVAMMAWTVFAMGCFGYEAIRGRESDMPRRMAGKLALSLVGGALAITAAVFRNEVKFGGVKPFAIAYVTVAGIAFVFLLLLVSLVLGT